MRQSVVKEVFLIIFLFLVVISVTFISCYKVKDTKAIISNREMNSLRGSTKHIIGTAERIKVIPITFYGTAWKKDKTQELVEQAILTGFRGVDTACQPKHYYQEGVGKAVMNSINKGIIARNELFIQTKYTPLPGQDPSNIPYDKNLPLQDQVKQSVQKSLTELQSSYIDSLLLHSPFSSIEDTLIVWKQFEEIVATGLVTYIGISNCYDLDTLKAVYDNAIVKPTFLQNRFYADSGYDVEIRRYCKEKKIIYQSFWTLTANPNIVNSDTVRSISEKYNKTPQQIWFAYVHINGMIYLTGTKSAKHMQEDLEVDTIRLSDVEVASIDQLL